MKTCMQCGAALKEGAAFCRLCGGAASAESFAQADVKYDAFISYRHLPLDKAVAEQTQKLLESFKPPKGIDYAYTDRITRIFRDESELPTSNDLGADIRAALEQSRYLIVMCSPALLQSKWCLEEIDYFKKLHNGRTNHILPVLIDGSPAESFPELLRYDMRAVTLEDGSQRLMPVEVEPLASNIAGNTTADVLKRLKTEFMRLAAPMLGCAFDDLLGRHQRREKQRVRRVVAAVAAAVSIFAGTVVYQNVQIQRQRDIALENEQIAQENEQMAQENERLARANEQTALRNHSHALADRSRQMQTLGSKTLGLLLALEALPDDLGNPEKPFVKEAQWALFENLTSETTGLQYEDDHVVWPVHQHASSVESEDGVFHAFLDYPSRADFGNSIELTLVNNDTNEAKLFHLGETEPLGVWFFESLASGDYGYFSRDGAYLFIRHGFLDGSDRRSAVIHTASGDVIYQGTGDDFAISGDGKFLAVSNSTETGGASIIDLSDNRSAELPPGQPLFFSADNEYFLYKNDMTYKINLLRWESGGEWVFVDEFIGEYAYFTDNGDIALLQSDGGKYLVDNNRNVLAGSFFYNENDGTLASITGEKSYLGAILLDTAVFYDAYTFDMLYELSVHDIDRTGPSADRIFRVLSNDGKFIVEYERDEVDIHGWSSSYSEHIDNVMRGDRSERPVLSLENVRLLTASGELLSSADLPSSDDYIDWISNAIVDLHLDKYMVLAKAATDASGFMHVFIYIYNVKTGERLNEDMQTYIMNRDPVMERVPSDVLWAPIRDPSRGYIDEFLPIFFVSHNGDYYINDSGVYEFDTGRNIMGDDFDFDGFINSLDETISDYIRGYMEVARGGRIPTIIAGFSQYNESFWFKSAEELVLFNIIDGMAVQETRIEGIIPTMRSPGGLYKAGFNENEGCIWDADTGELITRLSVPFDWHNADDDFAVFNEMNKGVFLEDEGVFISGSHIGRIIVWDIETGRILADIERDWVQIIPRNGRLLVLSETYAEWIDYRLEAIVERARQLLGGRELTTAERIENYCEVD